MSTAPHRQGPQPQSTWVPWQLSQATSEAQPGWREVACFQGEVRKPLPLNEEGSSCRLLGAALGPQSCIWGGEGVPDIVTWLR